MYGHFQQREQVGVTEALPRYLRIRPEPAAAIIDSQSIQDSGTVGRDSPGYASRQGRDGAKTSLLSAYLTAVAREAVDDEAVVPVMLLQPVTDDLLHVAVTDQLAGSHGTAGQRAQCVWSCRCQRKMVADVEGDEAGSALWAPSPPPLNTDDEVLPHAR